MSRVAAACAAVPGTTEEVARKTLAGFDEWTAAQPPTVQAGMHGGRLERKHLRQLRQQAYDHVCSTQFGAVKSPIVGFGPVFWLTVGIKVWELIWWLLTRNKQPAGDEA